MLHFLLFKTVTESEQSVLTSWICSTICIVIYIGPASLSFYPMCMFICGYVHFYIIWIQISSATPQSFHVPLCNCRTSGGASVSLLRWLISGSESLCSTIMCFVMVHACRIISAKCEYMVQGKLAQSHIWLIKPDMYCRHTMQQQAFGM